MDVVVVFLLGMAAGSLLTWLWISARSRWKAARGMMEEPKKTKAKMKDEAKKSHEKAEQGRRQMRSACLLYFAIAILTVFILALLRTLLF